MGVLGRDFAGVSDLDPMLSTVSDDFAIATQYIFHKLTTGALLDSDSPSGFFNFGRDLRELVGASLTDTQIAALGPELAIMLVNDPDGPVQTADVVVTRGNGLALNGAQIALLATVTAQIAVGPLRRVVAITSTGLASVLTDAG